MGLMRLVMAYYGGKSTDHPSGVLGWLCFNFLASVAVLQQGALFQSGGRRLVGS